MTAMEQALDALGKGQGAWTKGTAQNLADIIASKDARIERLEAAAAMALSDLELIYCHGSSVSADRIKSTTIPALRAALAGKEGT